jgi:amidophosphoribosyltransferase
MKGIVGVYSREDATRKALHNLYGVQHRGQESAGMTVGGDYNLRSWRGKGLVSSVFNKNFESFMHPTDYAVIGAACGENSDRLVPPVEFENERYKFSLAFDGTVAQDGGVEEGFFGFVLGDKFLKKPDLDIGTALKENMKELHYLYYSLVMVAYDKNCKRSELYVARDAHGIRPLYIARNDEEVFVTSESPPIDVMENMGMEIKERRDVTPGSLITVNERGLFEEQVLEPRPAHCIFEWVYFGRPDSVIEGRTVHTARKALGHELVKTHGLKPEENMVILPTPDSGRSVCTGVAEALGVTPDEGVIKNAYMGRTYIIDDPEYRKTASDLKHNIIKDSVKGKKVLITDDSIVRGTVSESISQAMLKAGAREIEFLVSYAPIFNPCFSDPEDKKLAAKGYNGKSLSEIGELVASNLPSIDAVKYNSVESVVRAVGLPEEHLCTMCVTGKNPFKGKNAPED